jgi:hypothetical protein
VTLRLPALRDVGLAAASVVVTLLACEVLARLFAPPDEKSAPVGLLTVRNFVADRIILFGSAYPSEYDPELGWVPKAGFASDRNIWGTRVTIDARGLRQNGAPPRLDAGAPLLLVGDSFVFGDEVDDAGTLPAHLENILAAPVANAGVFGYGIDQSVLRAERLAPQLHPRAIVLGFIPDDIGRVNISVRTGVEKPYFELDPRGELLLRNVPVSRTRPRVSEIGWTRAVFGYSYFADWLMRRLGQAELWYIGGWRTEWVRRDLGPAIAISCALLARLDRMAHANGATTLVVAEYAANHAYDGRNGREQKAARALLECAQQRGVETLDLLPALIAEKDRDLAYFKSLYARIHHSDEGNRWVAERVAEALRTRSAPLP